MDTAPPAAKDVLLITSSINTVAVPGLAIRDSATRLLQTICGILCWLDCPSVQTIVFCDNSKPAYDFSRLIQEAESRGKTLEVLLFDYSKAILERGKSYGEGEVLRYAMDHSIFLRGDVAFFKITGRVFVENFEELRAMHARDPVVFRAPAWTPWKTFKPHSLREILTTGAFTLRASWYRGRRGIRTTPQTVWTRFFKCHTAFFRKHLLHAYEQTSDRHVYHLEHAYYDHLPADSYVQLQNPCILVGRSSTHGTVLDKDYAPEIAERAKRLL